MIIIHDTLDLTLHPQPPNPGPSLLPLWIWDSTGHRDPLARDIWWLLKHVLSAQAGGTHPIGMLSGIFVIHSSSDFLRDIWSNDLALLIKSLIVLGTLRWGEGADAKLKLAYLPCKTLLYFVDNIST